MYPDPEAINYFAALKKNVQVGQKSLVEQRDG